LIACAADAALADVVAEVRDAFARRVGPFSPTDAWFEERSAALWDRVLTDRRALARMKETAQGEERGDALDALARAQRGLFEVHAVADDVDLVCIVTGAAFRLARADEAGRALASGHRGQDDVAPGVVDARLVPTAEGVSLLPGVLAHAPEARPQIMEVIAQAKDRAMSNDDLFDALLSMRHRLASLSRMKPKQVYRVEALDAFKASTPSP
jgi:hypothetical protein